MRLFMILICFFTVSLFALDSSYLEKVHKKDLYLMQKLGIEVKESFSEININWEMGEKALFDFAKSLLENKHDVMNAYKIFNYLSLSGGAKEEYQLYLGKCLYFIGELYYEGYIEKYYRQAYDIFTRLVDKNKKNIEYLRWKSFAAAKVGGFIRHRERGKFSGLSYLKESVSLNDDILDLNKADQEAILTEAEYQIETDNIPVFGGSKEKGLKLYFQVLQKNPNNMRANLLIGKYFYENGNPKKSLEFLYKALEVYDKKWTFNDMLHYYMRIFTERHLVRAYSRMGDQTNSWMHLQAHLALLPRSPSGLGALYDYLMATNQKKNACDVAKRLVELEPFGRRELNVASACQ